MKVPSSLIRITQAFEKLHNVHNQDSKGYLFSRLSVSIWGGGGRFLGSGWRNLPYYPIRNHTTLREPDTLQPRHGSVVSDSTLPLDHPRRGLASVL